MKKHLLLAAVIVLVIACQNKPENKDANKIHSEQIEKTTPVDLSKYPEPLQKVFKAHGGLDRWKSMQTITFTLGEETHTSDLNSRDIKVENPSYTLGSMNGNVWIAQDSTIMSPQRAKFYHNLMFYFYAMPFLLADDGIVYGEAAPLDKDRISYPAIKIGYKQNVGDSPDDEYILYYHPENYQMTWLAYTVTYGKNEKSDDFNYIKYEEWQKVNDLLLPKSLDWYKVENGLPTISRGNPRIFEKVDVDQSPMDATFYTMPDNGELVE